MDLENLFETYELINIANFIGTREQEKTEFDKTMYGESNDSKEYLTKLFIFIDDTNPILDKIESLEPSDCDRLIQLAKDTKENEEEIYF